MEIQSHGLKIPEFPFIIHYSMDSSLFPKGEIDGGGVVIVISFGGCGCGAAEASNISHQLIGTFHHLVSLPWS